MNIKDKIQKYASGNFSEVINLRRTIHQNPELAFEEYETSALVAKTLKNFGVKVQTGIAKTGVVGIIEGKSKGKTIALRADMDALPIFEQNNVDYKSRNNGKMHACGHDVHTSSLLGTAKILQQLRNEFSGTVKLIFQPSEEKIPGGASVMIKEGVLKNPAPSSVIGQHVAPFLETGQIGFRLGKYMASADEIYVTVKGKGGHAAQPHQNIDPVLIASHIIVSLQQIVSRNAHPTTPSVLSFGKFIAQGATNVIPNEVKLEGTFRTMDEKWRMDAHKRMKKMAEGIAKSMGGSCEFNIKVGYPVLYNHEKVTERMRNFTEEFIGGENVIDLGIWMASEDFAYYTHEVPGCFYRLGVGNKKKGIASSVHTPTFNIDERALEISTGLMAWLAVKELNS